MAAPICPLSKPQEYGRCHWCRKALKGRQKRWCSRECVRAATANHRWTQAKATKKVEAAWFLCSNAQLVRLTPRQGAPALLSVVGPEHCEGMTSSPEVNHKEPCKGKHGTWGCHHHQSNLEVLCPPCHKVATAKQRQEGKFK